MVEVGHPWSNVTVKRKLPPLKYYYDFEMSEFDGMGCVCLCGASVNVCACAYGQEEVS